MMQMVFDTLIFIILFFLITFQVVVMPRLQIGASMRLPDGSIPWLIEKSERGKTSCGSPLQLALSFSVFSLVWFAAHVGARLVMDVSWLFNPVSRRFSAESAAGTLVEFWFGISLMALLLQLALAPYCTIKSLWRSFDSLAVAASIPWALVACYTLWVLSPFSIDGR